MIFHLGLSPEIHCDFIHLQAVCQALWILSTVVGNSTTSSSRAGTYPVDGAAEGMEKKSSATGISFQPWLADIRNQNFLRPKKCGCLDSRTSDWMADARLHGRPTVHSSRAATVL